MPTEPVVASLIVSVGCEAESAVAVSGGYVAAAGVTFDCAVLDCGLKSSSNESSESPSN